MSPGLQRHGLLLFITCLGILSCRGAEKVSRTPPLVPPALLVEKPPIPVFGSETVSRRVVAEDGRSWRAAFDVSSDGAALHVSLRLKLVPGPKVPPRALEARSAAWAQAVEEAWSGCAVAVAANGAQAPVTLDVSFAPGARDPTTRSSSGG